MTEFEEYREHIQYTHNAFCRIVIRHASIDAARKLYSKWKREISLEYLSEEKFIPFAATDEYFAKPPFQLALRYRLLDDQVVILKHGTQDFLYSFNILSHQTKHGVIDGIEPFCQLGD